MGVFVRGIKNAFRNGVRSVSVILILSIAIGMTLVMLVSLNAVQGKIDSVKSSIGNTLAISPAGIRGFEGGGELLTSDDVAKISSIDGVTKVAKTLMDHLSDNTSLSPSEEAGTFGRRQMQSNQNRVVVNHDFKMPIMVSATSDLSVLQSLNISELKITSGEKFDGNTGDLVALVGSDLSAKNNLSVNSEFKAYDKDVKVVGIFDAGNRFANSQLFMPVKALQDLSGQTDQINSVIVQVSSFDKLDSVQTKVKEIFGDKADIVSSQDTAKQALTPLENIKTISFYSLIGSAIAGALILLVTMIMIVRERRREIGILKAIGASNLIVTVQFAVESLVLTVTASAVGIVLGTFLANPILKVLISDNAGATTTRGAQGHAMMMRVGMSVVNGAQGAIRDLNANVSPMIIVYGLLAAIMIAIVASISASFIIAKIRPAEVLRSE